MNNQAQPAPKKNAKQAKAAFTKFIIEANHPCLMAQTVFKKNQLRVRTYSDFGSKETAKQLLSDLQDYLANYDFDSKDFFTFIATFSTTENYSEKRFEELLWKQLQNIHLADDQEWDETVSSNPADKDFSFSIAGKAFYLVGLHPNSSRKARQAPMPSIAFNLHEQFEKLREMGAYQKVRDAIRTRDEKLQGHINPMLEDFGTGTSEAKQYSGRATNKEWKCPFHTK